MKTGLFWEEPIKTVRNVKRQPPDPVWTRPDYLPNLAEAKNKKYDVMTNQEIIDASRNGEVLIYDIEVYPNYFLIMFRSVVSKKFIIFEMTDKDESNFNRQLLKWVMLNFTTCGFNSLRFDNTLTTLAIADKNIYELNDAVYLMIEVDYQPYQVFNKYEIKTRELGLPKTYRHIDLMNVAPRTGSLKKYAGRLHIKQMQDLPFAPGTYLSEEQMLITKWYCGNDLDSTELLYNALQPQLDLRRSMTTQYGVDLMSKSDAQIGEAVFVAETKRLTGQQYLQRPNLDLYTNKPFKYKFPSYVNFQSNVMKNVRQIIENAQFDVAYNGKIYCDEVLGLQVTINKTVYTMGIGGLHSNEKSIFHASNAEYELDDHDVAAYYPTLIKNQGLYPQAIGKIFTTIYKSIIDKRLHAKRMKNKVVDSSLKIVINGSFGKFGDIYSYLFAPDLLIQTTITGQLLLLMLIERLELAGIEVVSANTDGIVTKCHTSLKHQMRAILDQWQKDTSLELEDSKYIALFSRDVNNYIAIKDNGEVKAKGTYALSNLELDPKNEICSIAVQEFLSKGIPIEKTVSECVDITKFVTVVTVNGGAVKDGEFLGKIVRFYHSNSIQSEIVYAKSGNKVPMSDNCQHLMKLPDSFPNDLDHNWYIDKCYDMINDMGLTISRSFCV